MEQLIGHQAEYNFLRHNTQAHAFLLVGQAGIGKTRIVEQLVAGRLCQQLKTGEPCGLCVDCQQVRARNHQDLCWVSKAIDKKEISIDQIREIKSFTNLVSFSRAPRCVMIEGVENLSAEASHALLKVLEEPNLGVTFYLTSSNLKSILPTIRSRAMLVLLGLVNSKIIHQWLVGLGFYGQNIDLVVNLAAGRPGVALFLLNNPELLEQYLACSSKLINLLQGKGWLEISQFIEGLTSEQIKVDKTGSTLSAVQVVNAWLNTIRDVMNLHLGLGQKVSYQLLKNELQLLADKLSLLDIKQIAHILVGGFANLQKNANQRLTLESLAIQCFNLCRNK